MSSIAPQLLQLRHSDRRQRRGARQALEDRVGPIIEMLLRRLSDAHEFEAQFAALSAFRMLGPVARCSGPALVRLLNHKDASVRSYAAEALTYISPKLSIGLIRSIVGHFDEPRLMRFLADVLGKCGPRARLAVPRLVELLPIPPGYPDAEWDWFIQDDYVAVAQALARIDPGNAHAMSALIHALGCPNERVAAVAARTLGRLAPSAEAALPALERALAGEKMLRHESRKAMARIRWRRDHSAASPVTFKALRRE